MFCCFNTLYDSRISFVYLLLLFTSANEIRKDKFILYSLDLIGKQRERYGEKEPHIGVAAQQPSPLPPPLQPRHPEAWRNVGGSGGGFM